MPGRCEIILDLHQMSLKEKEIWHLTFMCSLSLVFKDSIAADKNSSSANNSGMSDLPLFVNPAGLVIAHGFPSSLAKLTLTLTLFFNTDCAAQRKAKTTRHMQV